MMSQLVLAKLEGVELQFFEFFKFVNEVEEFLVSDDVHALRDIRLGSLAEHES